MTTPFTHALVSAAAGGIFTKEKMPPRFWVPAVLCSTLPDIDCLGFSFGIEYGHWLGHRGFTHSLPFALIVSAAVVFLALRDVRGFSRRWWGLWLFFFAVAASHGVLDAMTDGGLGVAFFSPFSNARYFLPWRPLRVSPIGLVPFLSPWGMAVIASEILWVWAPTGALYLAVRTLRAGRPKAGG